MLQSFLPFPNGSQNQNCKVNHGDAEKDGQNSLPGNVKTFFIARYIASSLKHEERQNHYARETEAIARRHLRKRHASGDGFRIRLKPHFLHDPRGHREGGDARRSDHRIDFLS